MMDVAIGRNMGSVKSSDIKKLLVSEVLPLACHLTGAMEPITMARDIHASNARYGTVKVEDDGSVAL